MLREAGLIAFVLIPLYERFVRLIRNYDIVSVKTVVVACQSGTASRYLRDASNLMDYEMKVKMSEVIRRYENGLDYRLSGIAMGMPWDATFNMRFLACGGFWSQCKGGWVSRVLPRGKPSGGFQLRSHDDGTTEVIHTEKYSFPWGTPLGFVIAPMWKAWLGRSMEVEMEIIKESLELIESNEKWRDDASRIPTDHPAVERFRAKRYGLGDFLWESFGGGKIHVANVLVYS